MFALLRAVGARGRQVRSAVIAEAAVLGLVGGTVGTAAGVALGPPEAAAGVALGPPEAAAAALALQRTTGTFHRCVKGAMEGDSEAQQEFGSAFSPFWKALENFIDAARAAHQEG
ncbi:ABC transporter permease [Streptomyces sp. NPDC045470]|uniref:ABC transporter permease n=1 Tax=Streptomyces sp. NPDC045470 TaxID=3155469 RepID=UPI0033FCF90A